MDPIYCVRDRFRIVRYVGVTSKMLEERLAEHLAEARQGGQSHRLNWFRSQEDTPTIEVIEWVLPMHRWERERYWISLFRDYGHNLVNATDGGDGVTMTPEIRKKISLSKTGKPQSVAQREANAARRGKPLSPASVVKRSLTNSGRKRGPFSLEWRANMSAARIGKKQSPEHVAASAAARTGKKRAPFSPAHRAAISKAQIGKKRAPHSLETREKQSRAQKGKKLSSEHKANLAAAQLRRRQRECLEKVIL